MGRIYNISKIWWNELYTRLTKNELCTRLTKNELYTRFLERTLHTIFCELKNVCKVRSLRKLNFKTGIVFYWNIISILVIKLNVLYKFKKNANILTMTFFRMNTNIGFLIKKTSIKARGYFYFLKRTFPKKNNAYKTMYTRAKHVHHWIS